MKLFIFFLVLFISFNLAEAQQLKNSGFEDPAPTLVKIPNWHKRADSINYSIVLDSSVFEAGKFSLRIENTNPEKASNTYISQLLPIKSNRATVYKISGFIKTEGVSNGMASIRSIVINGKNQLI